MSLDLENEKCCDLAFGFAQGEVCREASSKHGVVTGVSLIFERIYVVVRCFRDVVWGKLHCRLGIESRLMTYSLCMSVPPKYERGSI